MNLKHTSPFFLLVIVVMGHFCVDMMIGIWAIFKTLKQIDFAVAGMISTLCALFGEGMQLYFGHLSDRGHGKKLLLGGILAATSCAFITYTHHTGAFFCLFLLTCLGSGAFHPAAASLVSHLSQNRKGVLITLFAAGGSLGMALSQLLFFTTYTYCNGQTALLAIPALLLVLFVLFSSLPTVSYPRKEGFKASFELLRRVDLRRLYFSQILCQSVLWGFLFFLPDVLLERNYDSWIALGGGHLIAILGGTCMLMPAGYLADHYSCKSVLLAAITLSLFFLYAVLYLPFLSNSLLLLCLFFLGATLSVTNAVSVTFGHQLAPGHPGKVSALLMGMVWCVSEGIGQGGGGLLTKLFMEDAPARALSLLGALQVFAIGFVWKLPFVLQSEETSRVIPQEAIHDASN